MMTLGEMFKIYDNIQELTSGVETGEYVLGWSDLMKKGQMVRYKFNNKTHLSMHPDALISFVQQTWGSDAALNLLKVIVYTRIDRGYYGYGKRIKGVLELC